MIDTAIAQLLGYAESRGLIEESDRTWAANRILDALHLSSWEEPETVPERPLEDIGVSGAIFEPIHGSAPDIAGQHKINPTAAILSASLMLAHLGEAKAAADIEQAVTKVISEGKTLTQDMGGTASTEEFADAVIAAL